MEIFPSIKWQPSDTRPLWRRLGSVFVLLWAFELLVSGCINGEPSPGDLVKGNNPPIAKAGPDQNVARGATVILDGSESFDPDTPENGASTSGADLSFRWRFTQRPLGSGAALGGSTLPKPTFVADVDGLYRVELVVGEIVSTDLSTDIPGDGQAGAASTPDEVVIFAGAPGPFTDSGNKLLLDGSHFATTLLPMTVGGAANLTAEAWVWIDHVPAAAALIMGKESVFDLILQTDGTVVFQWFGPGASQTGGVPLSLQTWHHLAAVIDRANARGFLAVDGKILAAAAIAGDLNTNTKRFNVGGRDGTGLLTAMLDEVRVTDNVRYTADFNPPLIPLVADTPFAENFQNTVHGLWHFDELAGITLFADLSLRSNDLFLVGQTGFRPLTRLLNARIDHRALVLGNRIWVAGGLNEVGDAVVPTESIDTDDQVTLDADLNITTNTQVTVTNLAGPLGNGTQTTFNFSVQTAPPISGLSVSSDTLRVLDDGKGAIAGPGITTGTVNYVNGQASLTFAAAPTAGTLRIIAGGFTAIDDGAGKLFINGAERGTIIGNVVNVVFPAPLSPGSLKVLANTLTVTYDSGGNPSGTGIVSGLFNPTTGQVVVEFSQAPVANENLRLNYQFTHSSGISDHSLTKLSDHTVLIAGGSDVEALGRVAQDVATFYDSTVPPATLSPVGKLIFPRRLHTAGRLNNGDVLIVGGENFDGFSRTALNSVEVYDALGKSFSALAETLMTARSLHKMIALRDCPTNPNDDRFLVTGGIGTDNQPLASAERYDVTLSKFLNAGAMKKRRFRHAMVCLPDGKVLVTGGIDETGQVLRSAEIYDPVTGLFTEVESQMVFFRAEHSATLLPDNTILIAGGLDFLGPHHAAEIFNPVTQVFTRVSSSSLAFPRFGHLALPWKNGVAIIGGGNTQGQAIPLVEFYLP